jgi:fatty-acyl-CoA synthase
MDERGFLKITGRLKDLIIRGGTNIYPAEVELLLKEHPKVGRVAVVGVPSQRWGEEVGAVVIPKSADDMPTAPELDEYCKANLAPYKRPRLWYFAKALPFTPTGKVQTFLLREAIAKGELMGERT